MILKAFTLPAIFLAAVSIFGFKIPFTSKSPAIKTPTATIKVSPRVSPKVSASTAPVKLPVVSPKPSADSGKKAVATGTPKPKVSPAATATPPPGWEVPSEGYKYLP